jgi:O-antigen/teichoic acid export membrane protein
VPFLLTGIASQGATSAERWGLALRADPSATALFVQAVGFSMAACNAAVLPINTYFIPIISQSAARSAADPVRAAKPAIIRFLAFSLALLIVATLCVAVVALPLTTVLFGPRYRAIGAVLPWTMVGQALFTMGQAISIVPYSADSTAGSNGIQITAKLFYILLLLEAPCSSNCVLRFSQYFAAGNVVYIIGMIVIAMRTLVVPRPAAITGS